MREVFSRRWFAVTVVIIAGALSTNAQNAPASTDGVTQDTIRQLINQISELQVAVRELREEATRYRAESVALRAEIQAIVQQLKPAAAESSVVAPSMDREQDQISKLQEQYELLAGKVDEQYQTKVESASKYRVRFSGLALANFFNNVGAVDNQDVPRIALSNVGHSTGSFGATLRQTQFGVEVFGPAWRGARVKGSVQFDFGGGFPDTDNGATLGIMRVRTATMRLDWPRTSVVAGQDAPFFSPLSPTSLAALLLPALSYSGNLWTWTPQVRLERRFNYSEESSVALQAGILDPLTGQRPPFQFDRVPQAGEASRQPAYATRVAWSSRTGDRMRTIGIGGYYSRQNWNFGRNVDAWAATSDWSLPLHRLFTISGEFYRGRAIAGLGSLGGPVMFTGPAANPMSRALGLDSVGGWAQMKFQVSPTVEINTAAGQDNPFAAHLRDAVLHGTAVDYEAARNRTILTNVIYRPRSDLLFSLEYRRIQSFDVVSPSRTTDHINAVMGVLF